MRAAFRVTFLGHAGLYIEARHASILCDPWLSGPAYFGSWWPFPDNSDIDWTALSRPTYLYVSHVHQDHFDVDFLRDHVSNETTVLLPDYPINTLRRELGQLGFHRFVQTKNWEPVELDGLSLIIPAMVSPSDGPIGDSGLIVREGPVTIFDQNDSRPIHDLSTLGHVDLHFLQCSGAIGYPFLQGYKDRMREAIGLKKRTVGLERARRYIEAVGADHFFPSSGPPCFLDDRLSDLNDFGKDAGNVFPDQWHSLEYMRQRGLMGDLVVPGTVVEVTDRGTHVIQPLSNEVIEGIFKPEVKHKYLDEYRGRKQQALDQLATRRASRKIDVIGRLRTWWEPLLREADLVCAGVNGRMAVDYDDEEAEGAFMIDFRERTVRPWQPGPDPELEHRFTFPRALVEDCVIKRRENWTADLLLSFQFRERSSGPYNKYLFSFLSALSHERIRYVEGFYRDEALSGNGHSQSVFRMNLGGCEHLVQQRCPHASCDMQRFLEYNELTDVLTCTLHGWRWRRRDGVCLTAEGHRLFVKPADEVEAAMPESMPQSGADVRRQCSDCSYLRRARGQVEAADAGQLRHEDAKAAVDDPSAMPATDRLAGKST